jgi:capsular exopolysaccharide synthesis family protein
MNAIGVDARQETLSLHDYVAVIRRRKWLIMLVAAALPVAAVLMSRHNARPYVAKTQVLLTAQSKNVPPSAPTADRIAQTEADLASTPAVAARALAAAGVRDLTPDQFLKKASVKARANSDLLDFQVRDKNPTRAKRLATEYARAFTAFQRGLKRETIERQRQAVGAQLRALEAAGKGNTPFHAKLLGRAHDLQTLAAIEQGNAVLVGPAVKAHQVRSNTLRTAILAFGVALILGVLLAFIRETLDPRVRSGAEIRRHLLLPLLGRLGAPPRRLRKRNRLVMVDEPAGPHAESFRVLRTNLDFFNLQHDARAIMVTSALDGEGKSTTVANLALAVARTGRRVVLVDLDLRRPSLAGFFDIEPRVGVAEVARGEATLDDALTRVPLDGSDRRASDSHARDAADGSLYVVPVAAVPENVGEFFGSRFAGDLLQKLRAVADVVLIDAPPLLNVGDARALSVHVDGIVLVTRLDVVRRPLLNELRSVVDTCAAAKLGFVVTDAELEQHGGEIGQPYYTVTTREGIPT